MILRYGGEVMSDRLKVDDTLNIFFVNIGNTWKIYKDKRFLVETNNILDPVLKTLKKHSAHLSVININKNINRDMFSFQNVSTEKNLFYREAKN